MSYTKSQLWIMASRPKTLPAAVSPVIVGTAFAIYYHTFKFLPALAALIGALLLQVAANLSNDYYDHKKGADTEDRLGPTRVAASGLMSTEELFKGLMVVIFVSVLNGLYLIWEAGVVVLIIGVASIISMMAYSGFSIAYGYKGLGDIFVFVFFGLVAVGGTYYVQARDYNNSVLIGSIPAGCLITAILVVNNYRDLESDSKTGKKTLAVLMGKKLTQYYYLILLIVVPYMVTIILFIRGYGFAIFLPVLVSFKAVPIVKEIFSGEIGPSLNKTLAKTAQFGLLFNFLLSLGILLS